ncbi:MAG TPA: ribosome biogenesis GTP-binding protein YihA/YsxC [Polyangiaceae bacterium]|nr:ribosome biogenesis GTP-binding protein YihA/YsxC [Polyangiaceae bacterium]
MTNVVEAQFLAAVGPGGAFLPPTLPEVAFAGRSNVGKSSLINTLVARKALARTSSTPGCTRSINFFHIRTADDLNFQLVDLPGYGYAKRSKAERAAWGPLLERYLLERAPLRAVVLLVDVRRGLEGEEEELLEFLRQPSQATRPEPGVVLVATKIDKLPLAQRHGALAKLKRAGVGVIGFSSVTREGVDPLWKRLRYHLLGGDEPRLAADAAPEAAERAEAPPASEAQPSPASKAQPSPTGDTSPSRAEGASASPPEAATPTPRGRGPAPRPGRQADARGGPSSDRPDRRREGSSSDRPDRRREGRPAAPQAAGRGPSLARPRKAVAPGKAPPRQGSVKGWAKSSYGRKAPR